MSTMTYYAIYINQKHTDTVLAWDENDARMAFLTEWPQFMDADVEVFPLYVK